MSAERGTHRTKAVLVRDCTRPNSTWKAARTWQAGTPVIVEWYDSASTVLRAVQAAAVCQVAPREGRGVLHAWLRYSVAKIGYNAVQQGLIATRAASY